jgi:hypothetical protein
MSAKHTLDTIYLSIVRMPPRRSSRPDMSAKHKLDSIYLPIVCIPPRSSSRPCMSACMMSNYTYMRSPKGNSAESYGQLQR